MRFVSILAAGTAIAGMDQASATPIKQELAPPPIVRIVAPPVAAPATLRTEWLKASQIVGTKRVDLLVDGHRAAVLEWPRASVTESRDSFRSKVPSPSSLSWPTGDTNFFGPR